MGKVTESQEEILNFIKKHGKIKQADVIDYFFNSKVYKSDSNSARATIGLKIKNLEQLKLIKKTRIDVNGKLGNMLEVI